MTEADRAALVASTGVTLLKADSPEPMPSTRAEWNAHYRHLVRVVMAAIEPAIRADERARVVAEATTDKAIEAAAEAYFEAPNEADFEDWLRTAILAALTKETAP